ncbi:MFS transporter [Opitutus sp. ER46]|uniref:MFS transporter n=1 Tax=Opitutus sp. ER46 TaxID=2161864 RepID=UPI000D2F7AD8|nr:MFS transporter [Opitutus sp. ER46]PTX91396.1 MFS transporter [Opitutus sp. ER46]
MTNPVTKLPLREKLAYGCGDFASCLFWASFSNFLLLFYTDVFGITAAAAGLMFMLTRIWDGVNDPIMGIIADRTQTRWGKFRPWILWGCVPFGLMGVLLFTTPSLGMTGRLVWAYLTYNLMMMLYTAVNIPYTALLGVITPDPVERTRVSSIKFVFAFGAGLVIKMTLPYMIDGFGGAANPQRGWSLSFIVVAAVAVGFFLVTFFGTRERVAPPPEQKTSIGRDLKDLFRNGPWLILLGTTLTFILFISTRLTITAHYLKYFVGPQMVQLPWQDAPRLCEFKDLWAAFGVAGDAGSIVGVLGVGWFAARVGKKTAFLLLIAASAACNAVYFWLPAHAVGLIFAFQFLGNVAGGPLAVLLWAMYADTADYSEWKNGRRATGLVFSASTMSQKFGWAVCGLVAGSMLSATGFVPNIAQSPTVLRSLVLLMSLIPAALGALALVVACFYPLTDRRVGEIEAELRARRAREGATPA